MPFRDGLNYSQTIHFGQAKNIFRIYDKFIEHNTCHRLF